MLNAVVDKGEAAKTELSRVDVPESERTPDCIGTFIDREAGRVPPVLHDRAEFLQYTHDLVAGDDVTGSDEYKRLVAREAEMGKDMPGRLTAATADRSCGCGKAAADRKKVAGGVPSGAGAAAKFCTSDVCRCRTNGETCGPLCTYCWGTAGWAKSSPTLRPPIRAASS